MSPLFFTSLETKSSISQFSILYPPFFLLFFYILIYSWKCLLIPGWPYIFLGAVDGLELLILLPAPPQCWDYRCVLPCPVYMELGLNFKALQMLGTLPTVSILPNSFLFLACYTVSYKNGINEIYCGLEKGTEWTVQSFPQCYKVLGSYG